MPNYFQFQAPPDNFSGSIAELMMRGPEAQAQAQLRIGQAQAQAAQQKGAAWSGAIEGVGNTIAGIPGQIQQQKLNDQKLALGDATLAEARYRQQQQEQDQRARGLVDAAGAAQSDPTMQPSGPSQSTPNGVVPQMPKILGDDGLFDISAVTKLLAQGGLAGNSEKLIASLDSHNTALEKFSEAQQAFTAAKNNAYAKSASGILEAEKAGVPWETSAQIFSKSLIARGIPQQEVSGAIQQLNQLDPQSRAAALQEMVSRFQGGKPQEVPKGGALVTMGVDGKPQEIFRNTVPDKDALPGRAESKPIGLRMDDGSVQNTDAQFIPGKPGEPGRYMLDLGDGKGLQDITNRVTGVKPASKGLEAKSVLLDGKPAEVIFNPEDGKYRDSSGADVSSHVKPIPPASMTINQALVPSGDALEMAAKKYLATGELPSMGMGQAGAAARVAVMNRAAQIDPTASLAANKAVYKADSTNLQNLQKTEGTLSAFEATAGKNLDQFLTLAAKIPDTGVPWLNTPVRLLTQSMVGSENMAALNAARDVALREIARVTNDPKLSGVLSDSARKEVAALSPSNATLPQIKAVAKVLKQDMANVHSSLNQQIDTVKQGMGGNPSAPTAPPIKVGGFSVVVH